MPADRQSFLRHPPRALIEIVDSADPWRKKNSEERRKPNYFEISFFVFFFESLWSCQRAAEMKLFICSVVVGLSLFVVAEEKAGEETAAAAAANAVEVNGKEVDERFVQDVDDMLKKTHSDDDNDKASASRKRRSIAHGALSGALLGHPAAGSSYRVRVPGSLRGHAGHVSHVGRVDYLGAAGLGGLRAVEVEGGRAGRLNHVGRVDYLGGLRAVEVEGGRAGRLNHVGRVDYLGAAGLGGLRAVEVKGGRAGFGYGYGYGRLRGYRTSGLVGLRVPEVAALRVPEAAAEYYDVGVARPALGYAYGYGWNRDHDHHLQALEYVRSPVSLAGLTRGDYYEAVPVADDSFSFIRFYNSFTPLRAVKTDDNVYIRNYVRYGSFDDCLNDFQSLHLHEVKAVSDADVLANDLGYLSGAGVAVSGAHFAAGVERGAVLGYVGVMREYPYQVYALREGCHVDGYTGYHDCIVFSGATYPYTKTVRRFVYVNQPQVAAAHTVDRVIADHYTAGGWGNYLDADK